MNRGRLAAGIRAPLIYSSMGWAASHRRASWMLRNTLKDGAPVPLRNSLKKRATRSPNAAISSRESADSAAKAMAMAMAMDHYLHVRGSGCLGGILLMLLRRHRWNRHPSLEMTPPS